MLRDMDLAFFVKILMTRNGKSKVLPILNVISSPKVVLGVTLGLSERVEGIGGLIFEVVREPRGWIQRLV